MGSWGIRRHYPCTSYMCRSPRRTGSLFLHVDGTTESDTWGRRFGKRSSKEDCSGSKRRGFSTPAGKVPESFNLFDSPASSARRTRLAQGQPDDLQGVQRRLLKPLSVSWIRTVSAMRDKSLLSELSSRLSTHPENTAAEALCYVLRTHEAAWATLRLFLQLSGCELPSRLHAAPHFPPSEIT